MRVAEENHRARVDTKVSVLRHPGALVPGQ